MKTRCLILPALVWVFFLHTVVWAETWTNAAGKVLTARLEGVRDGRVSLCLPSGRSLSLPLSSLSLAGQERALRLTGQEPPPKDADLFFKQAKQDLHQAALLRQAGKITPTQYSQRSGQILSRFEWLTRHAATQRGGNISTTELDRCKASLRIMIDAAGQIPLQPAP
jgi:hypothetical protein